MRSDIWVIYVVSFLLGIATVVYHAARAGLLVSMLERTTSGTPTACSNRRSQGMRLLAPLAGAGLFAALGGRAVALRGRGDLRRVGAVPPRGARADDRADRDEDVASGWNFEQAFGTSLTPLTCGASRSRPHFVTLAAGVMEIAIFALIDEGLHRAPAFLGILSTAQGLGAMAGGVVVGVTMRRLGEFSTIAWALVALGVGVGLLATAELAIVLVAAMCIGIAVSFYNVAFVTLIQRRTDVSMQGRVMSAVEAASPCRTQRRSRSVR